MPCCRRWLAQLEVLAAWFAHWFQDGQLAHFCMILEELATASTVDKLVRAAPGAAAAAAVAAARAAMLPPPPPPRGDPGAAAAVALRLRLQLRLQAEAPRLLLGPRAHPLPHTRHAQVRITGKGIISLYAHKVYANLDCRVALIREDAATAIVFEEAHHSSRHASWETDSTAPRHRSSRASSLPDARAYSERRPPARPPARPPPAGHPAVSPPCTPPAQRCRPPRAALSPPPLPQPPPALARARLPPPQARATRPPTGMWSTSPKRASARAPPPPWTPAAWPCGWRAASWAAAAWACRRRPPRRAAAGAAAASGGRASGAPAARCSAARTPATAACTAACTRAPRGCRRRLPNAAAPRPAPPRRWWAAATAAILAAHCSRPPHGTTAWDPAATAAPGATCRARSRRSRRSRRSSSRRRPPQPQTPCCRWGPRGSGPPVAGALPRRAQRPALPPNHKPSQLLPSPSCKQPPAPAPHLPSHHTHTHTHAGHGPLHLPRAHHPARRDRGRQRHLDHRLHHLPAQHGPAKQGHVPVSQGAQRRVHGGGGHAARQPRAQPGHGTVPHLVHAADSAAAPGAGRPLRCRGPEPASCSVAPRAALRHASARVLARARRPPAARRSCSAPPGPRRCC